MKHAHRSMVIAAALLALSAFPVLSAAQDAPIPDIPTLMSDGVTPSVDPETGTVIVLPPGMPLQIRRGVPGVDVVDVTGTVPERGPFDKPRVSASVTCTRYHAGYIQNPAYSYNENTGGAVRIVVENLPIDNLASTCDAWGLITYWVLMVFANGDYIQGGISVYKPSPGVAKAFCESWTQSTSDLQQIDAIPDFGNNAYLGFTVVKDGSGVWRVYYADLNNGGVSIELGCTLTGHNTSDGQGNQYVAEVTPTTSTNVELGPMTMRDLRVKILTQWRYTTSITAAYQATPSGAVCPPYGAGPIAQYDVRPGTGRPCTTGTFQYPGP